MKIKSLELENFRGIVNHKVYFDPVLTVFAGRNGGGKSTILEAIAIMLSWIPVRIGYDIKAEKIKDSDITFGRDFSRLELELESRGGLMTLKMYKRAGRKNSAETGGMSAALDYGRQMRVSLDANKNSDLELPVFAFYRSNRNGRGAPFPDSSTRDTVYKNAFFAGTDFAKFSRGFAKALAARSAEMREASSMPLKKGNLRRVEISQKYLWLDSIRRALEAFLPTHYVFRESCGKLYVKDIPAECLSEGEKTVIALIADIAMRMVVANPYSRNHLSAKAIVLVDELDIHLHPDWQAAIAKKLPQIFPNAQFIISSHSPSVLSVAPSLYKIDGDIRGTQIQHVESTFGREPSDILATVMNAKRDESVGERLKKLYSLIDRRKFNEASRLLADLHEMLPDDPELVRADYLIRALNS